MEPEIKTEVIPAVPVVAPVPAPEVAPVAPALAPVTPVAPVQAEVKAPDPEAPKAPEAPKPAAPAPEKHQFFGLCDHCKCHTYPKLAADHDHKGKCPDCGAEIKLVRTDK